MSNKPGTCEICGHPMPPGEEMFKFHGYSSDCPRPFLLPLPEKKKSYEELLIERDQALAQAAALAGALEGLTNAALAELKPLPSQTELGFDALAKYREFLKGRE